MYVYDGEDTKIFATVETVFEGTHITFFIKTPGFSVKWGKWNPFLRVVSVKSCVKESKTTIVSVYVHPCYYMLGDAYNMKLCPFQTVTQKVFNELIALNK